MQTHIILSLLNINIIVHIRVNFAHFVVDSSNSSSINGLIITERKQSDMKLFAFQFTNIRIAVFIFYFKQ